MKQGQTLAEELSKIFPDEKLKIIAKEGCCAFCALWVMGIEDPIEQIKIIGEELGNSLKKDCTVKWFEFFDKVAGREIDVEFRDIKSLKDVMDVKGKCIVRYDFNGLGHWVGVEDGKVVYNPLEKSVCVERGKPAKARIIKWGLPR